MINSILKNKWVASFMKIKAELCFAPEGWWKWPHDCALSFHSFVPSYLISFSQRFFSSSFTAGPKHFPFFRWRKINILVISLKTPFFSTLLARGGLKVFGDTPYIFKDTSLHTLNTIIMFYQGYKQVLLSVSQIQINEAGWLFVSQFRPLLMRAKFFWSDWEAKIGLIEPKTEPPI